MGVKDEFEIFEKNISTISATKDEIAKDRELGILPDDDSFDSNLSQRLRLKRGVLYCDRPGNDHFAKIYCVYLTSFYLVIRKLKYELINMQKTVVANELYYIPLRNLSNIYYSCSLNHSHYVGPEYKDRSPVVGAVVGAAVGGVVGAAVGASVNQGKKQVVCGHYSNSYTYVLSLTDKSGKKYSIEYVLGVNPKA